MILSVNESFYIMGLPIFNIDIDGINSLPDVLHNYGLEILKDTNFDKNEAMTNVSFVKGLQSCERWMLKKNDELALFLTFEKYSEQRIEVTLEFSGLDAHYNIFLEVFFTMQASGYYLLTVPEFFSDCYQLESNHQFIRQKEELLNEFESYCDLGSNQWQIEIARQCFELFSGSVLFEDSKSYLAIKYEHFFSAGKMFKVKNVSCLLGKMLCDAGASRV